MESDHEIAFTIFLVTFFGLLLSLSQAYTFYVGGRDGWVLKPKEDYNHWAERNRFQINDTLIFRYKKGDDVVLQVSGDDYNNCYKEKPLLELKDGDSEFKFQRSGPFFFISGHADNCEKGQRLIIVVLYPRGKSNKAPSPVVAKSPSPSPASATIISPTPSPVIVNSPSPAAKVISPPPAPTAAAPVILAPAPAPAGSAATVSGGAVGSFLGLSLLVMATWGYLF